MTARPDAPSKKSVALSGQPAGTTAICTVGVTGNDLHYRGYDILDIAETCEFEEIAFLLIHGHLPNVAELTAYKAKLRSLRGLPEAVKKVLEVIPPSAHPMDVMRSGVSVLGTCQPEKDERTTAGARDIADKLLACASSMLLYWYHFAVNGRRIDVMTDDESVGGHFLHLLHGERPGELWVRAMHTSRVPTCTRASPARSARCTGPSTAAPTRSRSTSRHATRVPRRPRPTSAAASPRRR